MHTFQIEGVGGDLRVVHFEGQEATSELFRFDVTLVSLAGDLALGSAVGKRASLTFRARGARTCLKKGGGVMWPRSIVST